MKVYGITSGQYTTVQCSTNSQIYYNKELARSHAIQLVELENSFECDYGKPNFIENRPNHWEDLETSRYIRIDVFYVNK